MSGAESNRKKPPQSARGRGINAQELNHWESAHVCPKCGYKLNLAEIDLKAITTGIVSCPECHRAGPIEIQIVDRAT